MTMSPIQSAFRFHLQNPRRVVTSRGLDFPNGTRAIDALTLARADVASSKARYPAPMTGHKMRAGHDSDKPCSVYVENPESFGLRLVGRVQADTPRGDIWDSRGDSGWYTQPGGYCDDDICFGVVYQLSARKGQSRFVAAYQNGCNDSGALIDFATVYMSEPGGTCGSAQDDDAARDAARAADSMAEKAAESEREYQTAWRAGSDYDQEGQTIAEARQEALTILSERRAVKGKGNYPALCAAIRSQVESLLETIAEARTKRADLANGDAEGLYFWPGDKRLQEAFCEGANLDSFPA